MTLQVQVDDLAAARAEVEASGAPVSSVMSLPRVARWVDFPDPWGNQLGFYQDLAPTGEEPGPGGSVHDEEHSTTG